LVTRTPGEYRSPVKPTWCQDCGDYKVLDALMEAFSVLNIEPDNTVVVAGVGCSSRLPFYTNTYGFHTIHGRALPAAMAIKIARPDETVITVGGDGDAFSIGGNHFIHTARKNPDITYIVMDNEIYGLTKGQASPTTRNDLRTKVNPYHITAERINPVLLSLSFNTSFTARGYCEDQDQLKDLIIKGVQHKGFSFIHVLSPCTQYNSNLNHEKLIGRIQPVPENHDTTDRIASMQLAFTEEPLYTGLFYQVSRPTINDNLEEVRSAALKGIDKDSYSIKDVMKQFE